MHNKHLKQGFTLIELLVVVLIIGILAAVALPQYQKAVEKARATELMQAMSNLQKAVDMFLLENGMPAEQCYFLGEKAACSESLSIDIRTSDMDCSEDYSCKSKYFQYMGYCGEGRCRLKGDKIEGNSFAYFFNFQYENGDWNKECAYKTDYPYAKSICDSLISQGFDSWEY